MVTGVALPEVRPNPAIEGSALRSAAVPTRSPRGPSPRSASRTALHGQQVGRATHSLRAGSAHEACHQGIWVSVPCGHSGGLAEAAVALASSSPLPTANQ